MAWYPNIGMILWSSHSTKQKKNHLWNKFFQTCHRSEVHIYNNILAKAQFSTSFPISTSKFSNEKKMCKFSAARTPIAQQILQNIYKALVVHQFRIDVIDLVVEPTTTVPRLMIRWLEHRRVIGQVTKYQVCKRYNYIWLRIHPPFPGNSSTIKNVQGSSPTKRWKYVKGLPY